MQLSALAFYLIPSKSNKKVRQTPRIALCGQRLKTALSQKYVSHVASLLSGEKNGQRIGIRLSTVVNGVQVRNEANNLCQS